MNPASLIKLGAIGLGGYLLWQHFGSSSLLSTAVPGATTPATPSSTTPSTPSATPSIAPGPAPLIAPTTQGPFPNTSEATNGIDTQYKRAAAWAGWAHEAGDKKFDWHQWTYYRQRWNDTLHTPASEDVGQGNGTAKITAAEFHGILKAKGLAGLAVRGALYV